MWLVRVIYRGEPGAGTAAGRAEPLCLARQGLDVPRQRIVGLVTVQVNAKAARRGQLAQGPYRRCPIAHGALEMRDATDDLDALVERALKVRDRPRRAIVA